MMITRDWKARCSDRSALVEGPVEFREVVGAVLAQELVLGVELDGLAGVGEAAARWR